MPEFLFFFLACVTKSLHLSLACSRNFYWNIYDPALSVPEIFGRNGSEEIRQEDNEYVKLYKGNVPSPGLRLLRCAALKIGHAIDGTRQIHKS